MVRDAVLAIVLDTGQRARRHVDEDQALAGLHASRNDRRARVDAVAELVADGALSAASARPKLTKLNEEIDGLTRKIDQLLAESPRRRLIDGLMAYLGRTVPATAASAPCTRTAPEIWGTSPMRLGVTQNVMGTPVVRAVGFARHPQRTGVARPASRADGRSSCDRLDG
jgi:hypothetical protein